MKKLILFFLMGFQFSVLSQDVKGPLEFRYFGTAGFEITDGKTIILLDPYISRIKLGQSSIKLQSNLKTSEINRNDKRRSFKRTDIYESDTILIKKIIQKAISNIKVIKSNDEISYVELNPVTGRKHQLRKQLLNLGNPIIGDDKYFLTNFRKIKVKNLMLHAYKIKFMINNVQVLPIPVPHDANEPVQYIFSYDQYRLGILTDVGNITPYIIQQYNNCTGLIVNTRDMDICGYDSPFGGSYRYQCGEYSVGDFVIKYDENSSQAYSYTPSALMKTNECQ